MNSNSLFQSIQVLDSQLSDYNHLLQKINRQSNEDDQMHSKTLATSKIATALQQILSQ